MRVQYKTDTMVLEEPALDIGYASEKVTIETLDGKAVTLGGQNGKTQLIISTPKIDEEFLEELQSIDKILPSGGEYEVTASLVVANDSHQLPKLTKIDNYIDKLEEVGDFYGLRLSGAPFENELTKAVVLISKDGAIFYDDFVKDLDEKFNLETLQRKIMAAQTCYTGKGCH